MDDQEQSTHFPIPLLPWQIQPWQQLQTCWQQNRLPHALLFVGVPGLGKKQFALRFAHALLCNKPEAPCQKCHTCHLLRAQSHPDLMVVEPEQAGQMIKIDQIRAAVQFVQETALQSGLRIIIIHPANAMNIYAANALLKTLEEPAPKTFIILINDLNLRLPATILSRCQKIIFSKPLTDIALSWLQSQTRQNAMDLPLLLKLADGAPLKASAWTEAQLTLRQEFYTGLSSLAEQKADPLKLAAQLQEQDIVILLNLLLVWLQDMLRYKLTQGEAELINSDYANVLGQVTKRFPQQAILDYIDQVKNIYRYILDNLNLNRQLILEELLIRWVQYAAY